METSKEYTSKVAIAIREIRKISGTKFPLEKTVKKVCAKYGLKEDNIRTIARWRAEDQKKQYKYVED